MKISKQARREAKKLFNSCVINGLLDENRVRQAVVQILAARPRGYRAILERFQHLIRLDEDRRLARIESVIPLAGPFQNAIKSSLERRYGRGLNFSFAQNPALLGGVRIRMGCDVYDGTIRARLNAIEQAFEST